MWGRRGVREAWEFAELPSDEREPLGPTPVLDLLLPHERMLDVVVLLVPDQLHGEPVPGVLRTEADAVLRQAAFEVCRATDVESSVGAEKHVCVSHVLIMSATTDSPGGRACRDLGSFWRSSLSRPRFVLEVELVETSLFNGVVVSTSSTTGDGHRACRDDVARTDVLWSRQAGPPGVLGCAFHVKQFVCERGTWGLGWSGGARPSGGEGVSG